MTKFLILSYLIRPWDIPPKTHPTLRSHWNPSHAKNPSHPEPIPFKWDGFYPPDCHPIPRDGANGTGSWDGISHIFPASIWAAYSEDEKTQKILNALNTNQRILIFLISETKLIDRRIYFKNKMFVPNVGQLRFRFIQKFHDDPAAGHPGKTKTYEILSRYYYWPGIIDDVKRFVKNCYGCKKSKTSKNKYHGALKPLPVPDKRWVHISIDFIIDLPVSRDFWGKDCINIMVMVDRLSKMVKCIPMDGITTKDAAKAFYIHVWKDHGLPSFIISDRGRPFVSHFWEQLTTRLVISANLSTTYHPKTDGQTEIMNLILEQYLKAYVNYQNDLAFWLPSVEFAINNHASETTQCTFFLTNSKQHLKMGLEPDPVTTSVLNKEGLPGTSAKAAWAKRSGGTLERLTRWRRLDVFDVPPHIYISLPRR